MTRLNLWMAVLMCGAATAQDSEEPLGRAALNGDLAQVRSLLASGANPNIRNEVRMRRNCCS